MCKQALPSALEGGDIVVPTGIILQKLPHGFSGARARRDIIERFAAIPLLPITSPLTTDLDFTLTAAHCPLRVWQS